MMAAGEPMKLISPELPPSLRRRARPAGDAPMKVAPRCSFVVAVAELPGERRPGATLLRAAARAAGVPVVEELPRPSGRLGCHRPPGFWG